jgi:PKD repeat protein
MKTIARLILGLAVLGGGRPAAATPVESIAYQSCWLDYWNSYAFWCGVYVTTSDGSGHLLIENGIEPAWSPDGSRIAFSRFNPAGGLVVLDVVAWTLTEVTAGAPGRAPAWSPDGTTIVFRGGGTGGDLMRVNADGSGGIAPLTTSGDAEGRPGWSPDGSRIAYGCLGAAGGRAICTMNADGTDRVQLTDDAANPESADPVYSPDGTRIAFTTGGIPEGWTTVMTSEGTGLYSINGGYWPAWSPDGTRIATGNMFQGACQADGFLCYDTLSIINADGVGDPEPRGTGSHPSWTGAAQLVRPVAGAAEYCSGSVCFFYSTSWDMNGTIVGEAWDFGDGTTGSGTRPAHQYSASGTYDVTLTVTDNDGLTATTARSVSVYVPPPPRVPPVAAFGLSCTETQCAFNGTGSSDSDGVIVAYAWAFGDGATGTGAAPTHAYAAPGTYTATLTVSDDDGLSAATSHVVTVAYTRSHVGDLDRLVSQKAGAWTASVTVVVHDTGEGRAANAQVTGSWSIGGTSSCVTNAAGACTVSKASIPNKTRDVTFTVGTVTHAVLTYAAEASHDPDGDSNGRVIVVTRP